MTVDGYTPLVPAPLFSVEALFSVHYFEYASNYSFSGEAHDFWELQYTDKGLVEMEVDGVPCRLEKGDILFLAPGCHHKLQANGQIAPNLVVVSFRCTSPEMAWYKGRTLRCGDEEQRLMARMIDEAASAFCSSLNDPNLKSLQRREDATPGSEQMLKNILEILLITLYRKSHESTAHPVIRGHLREVEQQEMLRSVLSYFQTQVNQRLTLEQICRDNLMGRSQLQKLFRERTGCGVMEYFGRMKAEEAKRLIREGHRNFSEIAEGLSYNSIHYFSRHFKKICGMTPSEYAQSVQALRGGGHRK